MSFLIPFTKAWRQANRAAAAAAAAKRDAAAEARLEKAKEFARSAEARFAPLGATFTAWSQTSKSTRHEPVLNAFFRLPDSGILHRVVAETDGFTVTRL
jgi:Flp pilus assembly protein TadG